MPSTATTRTVAGLTNGTAYQFRVAAVNGIGTGAFSTASAAVTPTAGDPLFSSVSLLLPMDGTGATFVDASAVPKTITAAGGATQSTAQSKWGGKSAAFDGAGDYLSASGVPNIGTGNFVLEWWQRVVNVSAYQHIIGTSTGGNFMVALLAPFNGTGAIGVGRDNIAWDFVRNATLTNDTWQHVAISRSGSTMRMYVDGSLVGASASNSESYSIGTIEIGAQSGGSVAPLNGYIDDLRLTLSDRGYTGSTITVPSASFPTRGVYEDPFFESVSLLLPMDGTGSTFVDASPVPKTITAVNATQSTAQSKWGGKSLALNGSNANLSLPSSGLAFAGDFVIEGWLYLSSNPTYSAIIDTRASPSYADFVCGVYPISGGQRLDFVTGGGVRLTGSSTSVPLGSWSHFAFVRSGGVISAYVDGVRDATQLSYATSISPASATALIGTNVDGNFINGYIDDLRVTVGSARGMTGATITVPTAAFPTS